MQLVSHNMVDRLRILFREANDHILITSPYIGRDGARLAIDSVSSRFRKNGHVSFVTDLSPKNIYQSSTDPSAIRALCNHVERSTIRHLPCLHAKVYLADERMAIITSGNLTAGGLYRNYEYGTEITDRKLVSKIREDVNEYGSLGVTIEPETLDGFCSAAEELCQLFARTVRSASRQIAQKFEARLRTAEDGLIRLRLSSGAMHTVFEKTVLYLLKRHGPLTTKQLHPMISTVHPDLCDDTVDRVIDGKRFGCNPSPALGGGAV